MDSKQDTGDAAESDVDTACSEGEAAPGFKKPEDMTKVLDELWEMVVPADVSELLGLELRPGWTYWLPAAAAAADASGGEARSSRDVAPRAIDREIGKVSKWGKAIRGICRCHEGRCEVVLPNRELECEPNMVSHLIKWLAAGQVMSRGEHQDLGLSLKLRLGVKVRGLGKCK